MSEIRRIGITVDNYKLATFRKNLEDKGFKLEVMPLKKDVTLIRVLVRDADFAEDVQRIARICQALQLTFGRKQ